MVSEEHHAHIFSGIEDRRLEKEESLFTVFQWFAKFSKDSEYLILGKQAEAQVFRLCGGKKDYGYNYEDRFCEKCNNGVENTKCIIPSPSPEISQSQGLSVMTIIFIALFSVVVLLSFFLLLYIYRSGK